jgi:hypothetical protein
MGTRRHHSVRAVVTLVAALAVTHAGAAQGSVRAADVKAAFLYNFARFTEWPAEALPAGAAIVICVIGDPDVAQSLGQAVQGKAIDRRWVVVKRMNADGPVRSCQLVYAGGVDVQRARQVVDMVKGAAVLSVSDLPAFSEMGGMAHLFMEGERMRFAVNVDAAMRSNIRISAQLLNLARIVKDEHAASN